MLVSGNALITDGRDEVDWVDNEAVAADAFSVVVADEPTVCDADESSNKMHNVELCNVRM